jgi:asparagine synthase (glutamine-hydrolysing)
LKSRGVLSDDAVFVPGHAADFNAGSHMRKADVGVNNSANHLTNAILFDNFEYGYDRRVRNKLYRYFVNSKTTKEVASWSIYQDFIFQNRLPYNINNSARVYQFFGYDVRLPYWDKEFLELFRVMPYEGLEGCAFYTKFIRERIFIPMNVDFAGKQSSNAYFLVMKLLKRVKWFIPTSVRNRIKKADPLGELLLSNSMFQELIRHKQYSKHDKCSANQIMKDWYLLKVREMLSSM